MPAFGALVNSRKKGDHRSLKERNIAQKKHRENNAAASIRLITRDNSFGSIRKRASFTRRPQSQSAAAELVENKKGGGAEASWDSNDNDDYADLDYGADYQDTTLGWILKKIEPVIITLIVANAITMGMGTFDFVVKDPKMEDIFEIVDQTFLIIFTVEVSMAAFHYLRLDKMEWLGFGNGNGNGDSPKLYCIAFRPMHSKEMVERKANLPWISFDAIVVILSWTFQKLSIIRAFRILRALRIISKVESMRRVMRGVFSIGPKMGMVGFLLSLMMLVFGIMFTQLYRDLYIEGYSDYDYFGTFFLSLLTLFQIMTFDNWHWIARDAMKRDWWAWILFVIWVLVSGFVIMNMIIAIVCESLVKMTQDVIAAKEAKQRAEAGLGDNSIDGSIATVVDFRVYQMQEMIDETLMDQDELLMYAAQLRKVVRQLLVHDKVTLRNKMKLREVLKKIERKEKNKKNMWKMKNMLKMQSKTLRNVQDL